jgi:MFS transporter, SP family, galactose:H+ symporter
MDMFSKHNIYFIAFAAAISGLLFGYDAGIISGAMLFIKHTFTINDEQVGLIVSAVPIGALISAVCIGKINDLIGRKKILIITAICFAAGSLLCGSTPTVSGLIIGRFILGLAVGMSSSAAPMYIAEITEEKNRGALVTLYLIAVNGGVFVSYLINYAFSSSGAWRTMLMLGIVPAIILGICALSLPESPRWLMLKGKMTQAIAILERLHDKLKAQKETKEIQQIIAQEKATTSIWKNKNFLRIIVLGAVVSIFTQAVGINAIIYYAPTIFQKTGFDRATVSILATVGIGFTVTLAAVLAAIFIDKIGRRKLLLSGLAGIIFSLIIIIYAFYFVTNPQLLGWLVLLGSILFVLCQGLSVGPACFLIPSEIFPAKIRGTGMGISIAFNWLTNGVITFLFPLAITHYSNAFCFALFLTTSIIGWFIFYIFVPETQDITLEKIESNLLSGIKLRYLGNH